MCPAGPSSKKSAVLLVVEDELPIRMVIADALSDLGCTVLEAGDGHAGLDFDAGTSIDLLITDVGLPGGMNGRQLADAARERRPNLNVPHWMRSPPGYKGSSAGDEVAPFQG